MMDPKKVEATVSWPHPMNIDKLQIFLGMAGKDYAKIVVPMLDQGEEQRLFFHLEREAIE